MKIELQLGTTFGKKVCPISKTEFIEQPPYIFLVTEGKFKGQSVNPETALRREFTIAPETYQQIQRDYSLARQKEALFCWDRNINKKVAELLRFTGKDLPNKIPVRIRQDRFGRPMQDPHQLVEIKGLQNSLLQIAEYLDAEGYKGYMNNNALKWNELRANRIIKYLNNRQGELIHEIQQATEERQREGLLSLQADIMIVIKFFQDQVN